MTSSLASFTDWRWCTGRHKNCVALRPPRGFWNHRPLLASDDFQGPRGLKQKRKLSPGPDTSGRKPDPVARARHTCGPAPPVGGRDRAGPNTGHGMITVFPFATASPSASMVFIIICGASQPRHQQQPRPPLSPRAHTHPLLPPSLLLNLSRMRWTLLCACPSPPPHHA